MRLVGEAVEGMVVVPRGEQERVLESMLVVELSG
jgi:hypothetical protein